MEPTTTTIADTYTDPRTGFRLSLEGMPAWTCPGCDYTEASPTATKLGGDVGRKVLAFLHVAHRSARGAEPEHAPRFDPAMVGSVRLTLAAGGPANNVTEASDLPTYLELSPTDAMAGDLEEQLLADDVREGLFSWIDQWRHRSEIARLLGPAAPAGHGPRPLNLWGVPGVGKSFIAKVIAEELGRPLLEMSYGALQDSKVGATEDRLSRAFKVAKERDAVLFIDEADGLVSTRLQATTGYEASHNIITNHLIQEVNRSQLPLVLATNFRESYDPALASRFSDLYIPVPDRALRLRLWRRLLDMIGVPVRPTMTDTRIAELDDMVEERGFGPEGLPFTPRNIRDDVLPKAATRAARAGRDITPDDVHQALGAVLDERVKAEKKGTFDLGRAMGAFGRYVTEGDRQLVDALQDALREADRAAPRDRASRPDASDEAAARLILQSTVHRATRIIDRRVRNIDESGLAETANRASVERLIDRINAERDDLNSMAAK